MNAKLNTPLSVASFEQALRDKGKLYHIHHPFHVAMHEGRCTPEQIRGWVANRFYYQANIPLKDAAIMANCPDREIRREWIQRILDHDGRGEDEGGIEAWIDLGAAVGLTREELLDHRHVLPAVRFAVDAYVNFARTASWQEAVCSSLTEMFAPEIHQRRLDTWPEHYPWIDVEALGYFRKRLKEARRDVDHGLTVTLGYFRTAEQQQRALNILQFKLDVLWSLLDAVTMAYVYQLPPYHHCQEGELA
ncbi:pyrroloquinoline-quinone synthase PqqC [Halioxenophilus sp. WMMB6]|uniref:pyrroloquinoline-quinone synthase PqqC n=1 Tax=Halioxenophilus sp. WMMB6 TaxID=3073815 RepID=UPI00295F0128|nr:pyrroloquinoline-quinone synthase PqqC [Halioxenophilus sp. WMMB6]